MHMVRLMRCCTSQGVGVAAGWLVDELVKEFDLWLVHVAAAGMRENFSLIFKINFQP